MSARSASMRSFYNNDPTYAKEPEDNQMDLATLLARQQQSRESSPPPSGGTLVAFTPSDSEGLKLLSPAEASYVYHYLDVDMADISHWVLHFYNVIYILLTAIYIALSVLQANAITSITIDTFRWIALVHLIWVTQFLSAQVHTKGIHAHTNGEPIACQERNKRHNMRFLFLIKSWLLSYIACVAMFYVNNVTPHSDKVVVAAFVSDGVAVKPEVSTLLIIFHIFTWLLAVPLLSTCLSETFWKRASIKRCE